MRRSLRVLLPIVLCGTLSGCSLLLAGAIVPGLWGVGEGEGECTPELGYMVEASPQYASPGDRVDLHVSASWSCSNEPHTMPDTTYTWVAPRGTVEGSGPHVSWMVPDQEDAYDISCRFTDQGEERTLVVTVFVSTSPPDFPPAPS